MVLLVPRQLRMAGMTGRVPYYGGRFSPAQAYAAARPYTGGPPPPPPGAPAQPVRTRDPQASLAALDRLLADGVVSRREYDDLRARVLP
jgi:hypothetical protein